ncbi:MAG: toxin-antitoxin system HicB family antitoxin [Gammaproteobacteria bacterium]
MGATTVTTTVRIDEYLHARVVGIAREGRQSLNGYILKVLDDAVREYDRLAAIKEGFDAR